MEWISVRDKLPETMIEILATDGKHVDVGLRSNIDNPFLPDIWLDFHFPVSHWMPLPELPKPINET